MSPITKETEVYGIEAQIIAAGCKQYRITNIIPEADCEGRKILDLAGFPIEVLDTKSVVVRSLLKNGSLIRVNGGFRIAMSFRER